MAKPQQQIFIYIFFIKVYNFFYSISLIKEKEEPIVKKFVGQGKRDITKSELQTLSRKVLCLAVFVQLFIHSFIYYCYYLYYYYCYFLYCLKYQLLFISIVAQNRCCKTLTISFLYNNNISYCEMFIVYLFLSLSYFVTYCFLVFVRFVYFSFCDNTVFL